MSRGDIFIVDDNPHNLGLLTQILRDARYAVRMINSSKRALTAIKSHLPELLMLDINMPEMSGYELCEALKADAITRDIPVIFLSALDDVQDKVQAFTVGGLDYVTKPFHPEEVLARVETQLSVARLRRALEEKNRELEQRNRELTQAWEQNQRMFVAMAQLLPGSIIDDKYRIDTQIGEGGFAVIYKGLHLSLGRPVAIKVLRPDMSRSDPSQLERFRQEGVSAIRVQHPNAVAILDSGVTASGIAYLVMELLSGQSLSDELRTAGTMTLGRTAAIISQVCAALDEAHRRGIIHRDIKPSNVFLHRSGNSEVVKVVDFGIAKIFGESTSHGQTTMGRLVGTPMYMSPERLMGAPYDAKADVFSLGVMLYEMISGDLPVPTIDGGLGATILAYIHQSPAPLGEIALGVPGEVEILVHEAMAKSPDKRPTVSELAQRLSEAIVGNEDWISPRLPPRDPAPTVEDTSY